MLHQSVQFNQQHTDFYFDASFRQLKQMLKPANTFIITDTNIFPLHTTYFKGWKTIVIPAGEAHKNIATVQYIIEQLIQLQADRTATLVGVGGGRCYRYYWLCCSHLYAWCGFWFCTNYCTGNGRCLYRWKKWD